MANIETITVGSTTYNVATTPANMEYSTSEKVVGTWVTGKPLYQKTIAFNMPANLTQLNLGLSNVETAFIDFSSSYIKNSGELIPLGICWTTAQGTNGMLIVNNGSVSFRANTLSDWVGKAGYITLRYTKTTD